MANKNKERTISGFGSVANGDESAGENSNSDNNFLNDIIDSKQTKDKTHIFKGFYLERDIANTIDKYASGKPKGVKSDIVNEALRRTFKDMGWME